MSTNTLCFFPFVWDSLITELEDSTIKYKMFKSEGKVKKLATTPVKAIRCLDCSGYVQYVLYKTTYGNVKIPQGSWKQKKYFFDNAFVPVNYIENAGKRDNIVRIAFRDAKRGLNEKGEKVRLKAGHVWFIYNGMTHECTKIFGNNGPASIPWNKRISTNKKRQNTCFEIGQLSSFKSQLESLNKTL